MLWIFSIALYKKALDKCKTKKYGINVRKTSEEKDNAQKNNIKFWNIKYREIYRVSQYYVCIKLPHFVVVKTRHCNTVDKIRGIRDMDRSLKTNI